MLKLFNIYNFIFLFSLITSIQEAHSQVIAPPVEQQVKQVTQWFSGSFSNARQVKKNPDVPLITMNNCSVVVTGSNLNNQGESIYLEQATNGNIFRVRYYEFSPSNQENVVVKISSFAETEALLGMCDRPSAERIIEQVNINPQSCELELFLQFNPLSYIGNNAPDGCPGNFPIAKVVSQVVIESNKIYSLDQGFDANNNLLFGTPIEFNEVPEPNFIFAFVSLGFFIIKAKSNSRHLPRKRF